MDSTRPYSHTVKKLRVSKIFLCADRRPEVYGEASYPPISSTRYVMNNSFSGKTYTMDGTDDDPGIKILAAEHLFKENQSGINRQFIIRVGYVEIYNEMIYDLLNRRQNVHFDLDNNMSNTEVIVNDRATLLALLRKGNSAKTPKIGNERPTSHTIFQIVSSINSVCLDILRGKCGFR